MRADPVPGRVRGRLVVLDAGHQLGNHNFPDEISRQVPAGGFEKDCNTTGTATDDGYPEASFAFDVTSRVASALRARRVRVVLTRRTDSERRWGPCVDARGRAGNDVGADLKVSLHADGSWQGAGFHVIEPAPRALPSPAVRTASYRLATALRDAFDADGFARSTYRGRAGLDRRRDLATLNLSRVPVALVECGNMRDPAEAAVMESARGRQRYADAVVAGVLAYLRS